MVADPTGDIADFGPLLPRFVPAAICFSAQYRKPLILCHFAYGLTEAFGHIGSDGEVNGSETFVAPFGAVAEQVLLVSGGIRADTDLLDALGELLQ